MITRQSHLPAALASELVHVEAIVDPVERRAAELARDYGLDVRIAPRVEDVLAHIDGAIIATPNNTHRSLAVACLDAGVSVLIEKPLASSYDDGAAIVRAADDADKVVAVGYATRFRDNVRLLKSLLDEGYFGSISRFAHQFGSAGGWAPLSAYNLDRRAAGGGVLVVTGTHFLDRMLHLWGYPDAAYLEDDSLGGPEANCTATFRYDAFGRTVQGIARYSKTVQLPAGLVVETDEGFVIVGDTDDAEVLFRAHGRREIEQVVRARDPAAIHRPPDVFQRQLEDFVAACVNGIKPQVAGHEGLLSLRLIEELYANRRSNDHDPYAPTDEVRC